MRVIAAPDSFKGSISAADAAEAIARGAGAVGQDVIAERCPVADGGEGTLDAILTAQAGNAQARTAPVTGPLGEPIQARWGLIDAGQSRGTAVIEIAQAAGLDRVPEDQRDPTRTTTFGVGQLITAALDAGAGRLLVGLGGSATTDGGAGMAQALGTRFTDRQGNSIDCPMTGGRLADLGGIDLSDLDPRLGGVEVVVASDVTNPLTGEHGAAAVYGPQKGASPNQVRALDRGLSRLTDLLHAGRTAHSVDPGPPHGPIAPETPGCGAAGGLGFGLIHFCGASLTGGAKLVLDAVNFDHRVREADLVLTGEGRLDGQSVRGKACLTVAQAAAKHRVPTIALVGSTGEGVERVYEHGLCAWLCITDGPMTFANARRRVGALLERAAGNAVRCRLGSIDAATEPR